MCHACGQHPCTCATTLVATVKNPHDADVTAYVHDHASNVAVRLLSASRHRAGGDPLVGHVIAERKTRVSLTLVGKEVLRDLRMSRGEPSGFLVVRSATIDDDHRGLGWGVLLYQALIRLVAPERRALVSEACEKGGSTSAAAASVWNRLGPRVRSGDDYCFMAMDER
jgi:GNAT superfamily N-acetyltransferase